LIDFDVLIIGGGPAGSSAAIALLKKGYPCAIIEKSNYDDIRFGETLPPTANHSLNWLQVDKSYLMEQHLPSFANKSAWGNAAVQENNFMSSPDSNGWHLDRTGFDKYLALKAKSNGAYYAANSSIKEIRSDKNGGWIITFTNAIGETASLKGKFIIDASGKKSIFAHQAGARRIYADHLIGAAVLLDASVSGAKETNYTLVEAQENGWWYSADLPRKNKIITIFFTDPDLYKDAGSSWSSWLRLLAKTELTRKRILQHSGAGVQILPAGSSIINRRSGTDWMCIGDAAMMFDPLSSSGISRAMKEGIQSADIIDDYFKGDRYKLGTYENSTLEKFKRYYAQRQRFYNLETRWKDYPFWKRRIEAIVIPEIDDDPSGI